jgi:ryanodine receptor 2
LKPIDNVDPKDGSHITMVTADHMNQLLKLVLKLIMKHIGDDVAEWMTKIAVYAQQIIINTSEELLKDPILPLAEKLRKKVEAMFAKEESLKGYLKAAADDASQIEGEIQEEWNLIARDIYAFYPLLIKYVDLQRSQWIRQNTAEAEDLYNHVGEIFNIMSVSAVSLLFETQP